MQNNSDKVDITQEELYLLPEETHQYQDFMNCFYGDDKAMKNMLKLFSKWVYQNRVRLQELHEEYEPEKEFFHFARGKFFIYTYNRYKADLVREIGEMTA